MKYTIYFAAAALLLAFGCKSGSKAKLQTSADSVSYVVGVSTAQNLLELGLKLDTDAFLQGFVAGRDSANATALLKSGVVLQSFYTDVQMRNGKPYSKDDVPPIELDSLFYYFGMDFYNGTRQYKYDFNPAIIATAMDDTQEKRKPALDSATQKLVMEPFMMQIRMREQEMAQEEAVKNQAEGIAFLEDNKKNKGVVVLPSGLQYEVIKPGSGVSPTVTQTVRVNYEGRFISGEVFDSSYERGQPAEFAVNGVISGWTEALMKMKPGAKWKLYVPSELAYGERGNQGIPPNSTLIFEVELLEVVKR